MAAFPNYRLTIQLALDGFSFALFDIVYNKLIAWDDYHYDHFSDSNDLFYALEKAINIKGLNEKNPSIVLIYDDRTNILVPQAIYHPDDNNELIEFSFNTANDFVTMANPITKHKIVNVFALPQAQQTKIASKWPGAKITHSTSVFLESLPQSKDTIVYVNVRSQNFDIAIMKNRLLFFNNFQFNNKNDFVYFLLNVLEQHNLSNQDTTVCFSGQILPTSEIIDLCGHYVRDIRFVEKPNTLQVDASLAKIPYQYYHIQYQTIR